MPPIHILVLAFSILLVCVYTDLRERKIYNKWTITGMIAFIFLNWFDNFLLQSVLGLLVLGVITYLTALISRGGFGGGDVKLYAMLGAAFGYEIGIWIFIISNLVAAIVALPLIVLKLFSKLPPAYNRLPMAPYITIGSVITILIFYYFG